MDAAQVLAASKVKPNPAKGQLLHHANSIGLTRGTPMDRGLDVSHAQSPTGTALLGMLASGTYQFQIVKATEGQHTTIAAYPGHRANGARYGLRHGAYHFAWCSQDPLVEAANFCLYAGLKPGEIACLDLENWGPRDPATGTWTAMVGVTWATRIDYAIKWLREVKRLTGATSVVYMNWEWIKNFRTFTSAAQWAELCTYPLWLADYDSNAPGVYPSVNPKVAGGPTLITWLHQWTASKPANDGGLDGDACMDPSLWATYAVPQKEMFTVGQFEDIMAAIAAVNAKVDTLNNKVEQKANIVDVKAVTTELANVKAQVSLVGTTVTQGNQATATSITNMLTEQAKIPAAVQDVHTRLQGDIFAIGDDLDTRVGESVKGALTGVEITTTTKFPTG